MKQNSTAKLKPLTYERPAYTLFAIPTSAQEYYLTASVKDPQADPATVSAALYRDLAQIINDEGLELLFERILGLNAVAQDVLKARSAGGENSPFQPHQPLSYIEGLPLAGGSLAGVQLHTIARAQLEQAPQLVQYEGKAWGRVWEQGGDRYFHLQNVHGLADDPSLPADPQSQASRMFERAQNILRAHGTDYTSVVRTWIYLDGILDWYAEFNDARSAKYREWGLMPDPRKPTGAAPLRLPASTGIHGRNPLGAACVMDVAVFQPGPESGVRITQLSNARQKDAFRYGRAFSRGAWMQVEPSDTIHISGTAAIDEAGISLFPDDARAQIDRTLDNIEALLAPTGSRMGDISCATVFLKRAEDAGAYWDAIRERGLARLPAVCLVADVCRPELLFEMDALAVRDSLAG